MDLETTEEEEAYSWDSPPAGSNLRRQIFDCSSATAASVDDGHSRRASGDFRPFDLNSQASDPNIPFSFTGLLNSPPATVFGTGTAPVHGSAGEEWVQDLDGDAFACGRGRARGTGGRGRARANNGGERGGRGRGRGASSGRGGSGHGGRSHGGTAGRGRGNDRGAGTGRPLIPPSSMPYRVPCPTGSMSAAVHGNNSPSTGFQESDESNWSEQQLEDTLDDFNGNDASMNYFSSDDSFENSSTSDDDVEDESIQITKKIMKRNGAIACIIGMYYEAPFMNKKKRPVLQQNVESGYEWTINTLNGPTECYDMFRMSRELFYQLHDLLVSSYDLKSSNKMCSIESLGMFLWIVGAQQSIRQAKNRFKRSLEIVSRRFEDVLESVYKFSADIVKVKDPEFKSVHPRLQEPCFSPHFSNCIGAIDGTHIPVVVPSKKVLQYVGRSGKTTQNVLAICDFDMKFTFGVAGWPGSVHDMRVFNGAINKYEGKFPRPPPGKFYLVDSGYPNRDGYLVPYKGTKYHLPEFRQGPRPKGSKELFNYYHSSLRNIIERFFAVLKNKWRILRGIPSYPLKKQSKIILACMALHNFIRENAESDEDFDRCDEYENYVPGSTENFCEQGGDNNHTSQDSDMNTFCDIICNGLMGELE